MLLGVVPADLLYRKCDLDQFAFETTAELEDLQGLVGQDRALEALRFGVRIDRPGYNLFVMGPPGAAKHEAVKRYLEEIAVTRPAPSDWAYVNNFEVPHKPIALELSAGQARALKEGMARLVDDLKVSIPAILEGEEYQTRRQSIDEEYEDRQEKAFEKLRARAQDAHIALLRTPAGFALAPIRDGKVIKPDEFNRLPEDERHRIEAVIQELQKELAEILEHIPGWQKEHRERIQSLNRDIAVNAVSRSIRDLLTAFEQAVPVKGWIEKVQADLVDNIDLFAPHEGPGETPFPLALLARAQGAGAGDTDPFRRYEVNVIVANGNGENADRLTGAPVSYDDHPTLANLVGRVEHLSQLGALVTDFSLIKAGSLHRANGGYLLLDVLKLLRDPLAWDALKRALHGGRIKIESPGEYLSLISTVSLEPDPIPLNIKVALFGPREFYYLLCAYDPDFQELFKVAVDFDDVIDRGPSADQLYARLLSTTCREENLLHLDREAVGLIIERSARLAEDAEKLSAIVEPIANLVREADFFAREAGVETIGVTHVEAAIAAQIARADRMRQRSQEAIARNIIKIDTDGETVGQVNGLSVLSLGSASFGRPSRITARVRMGSGGARLLDIEREVELGGPLHSKGVLILSAYLSARFLPEKPLSMSASLVFEQSYGGVDGDSASSAELYALISALAEAPIAQGFAVTGSVNQLGEVQAIGGVNEKIEGFYDICAERGLTGRQGVLIPASNVKHLMLRKDVVDAVERGVFAIYPVERVEQGIELLMGAPAGERGADGDFPDGTIFARVETRLTDFAENLRKFGKLAQLADTDTTSGSDNKDE